MSSMLRSSSSSASTTPGTCYMDWWNCWVQMVLKSRSVHPILLFYLIFNLNPKFHLLSMIFCGYICTLWLQRDIVPVTCFELSETCSRNISRSTIFWIAAGTVFVFCLGYNCSISSGGAFFCQPCPVSILPPGGVWTINSASQAPCKYACSTGLFWLEKFKKCVVCAQFQASSGYLPAK